VRIAARKEKPLNGLTLDTAAGWNRPASQTAEETVERLRKPEGGSVKTGIFTNWMLIGDVVKRDETQGR
jgi:hypothetical protein